MEPGAAASFLFINLTAVGYIQYVLGVSAAKGLERRNA